MYPHQDLTYRVIAAAIEVHKNLDPGLLEAVYFTCLSFELEDSGLYFEKELDIPLLYKDRITNRFLRLDFLVENKIVLELKSVETVLPVHEAQLLTYLKLTGKQIGLLINFNVPLLKNGIHRRILGDVSNCSGQEKKLDYTEKTEPPRTQRGCAKIAPL